MCNSFNHNLFCSQLAKLGIVLVMKARMAMLKEIMRGLLQDLEESKNPRRDILTIQITIKTALILSSFWWHSHLVLARALEYHFLLQQTVVFLYSLSV